MRCLVRISKRIIVCFVGALLILVAIGWRSRLPSLEGRTTSSVLLDTAGTRIGQSITPLIEAHPGLSGIYPLEDSRNAFAARALLAAFAERTLDVQY